MNNNIKSKMRDDIIVQMQQYLDNNTLQILDSVLVDLFEEVDMQRRETLPAEVRNSIDEKNKYIIQLFIYKKSNLSPKTITAYLEAVKMLLTYTDKELTEVNDIDITGFLKWYQNRNKAKGKINNNVSVNNMRKFVSAFFGWMRKEKLINDNPVETIPPLAEPRKPIDYFTRTEMEKLREACRDERERALIETLRSTGARVGELLGINRFQINWDNGDVYIKGEKGGKYRLLYLDEECRYYLKKYLEQREDNRPELFLSAKAPHNPLRKESVELILQDTSNYKCIMIDRNISDMIDFGSREKGEGVPVGPLGRYGSIYGRPEVFWQNEVCTLRTVAVKTEEGDRETFVLDQMEMWDFAGDRRNEINGRADEP